MKELEIIIRPEKLEKLKTKFSKKGAPKEVSK